MTFISYSQNFEDVMLRRALAKVSCGFYIDVGAAEPFADSVTAAFYKQGWRGINIEPMDGPYSRLVKARPEDINLQVALEDKPGSAQYFSINGGNGISTGVSEFGKQYREANWDVELVPVVVETLKGVCQKYVGEHPIHFLKIDVEGKERAVLLGGDFEVYRPWIVVVEATQPNSQVASHLEWEQLLDTYKYSFVYFDGLNRFYIANEKFDTFKDAFSVPPNWFDHFLRASEAEAVRSEAELKLANEDLKDKLRSIESEIVVASQSRDEAFAGWKIEKAAREELEARLNSFPPVMINDNSNGSEAPLEGAENASEQMEKDTAHMNAKSEAEHRKLQDVALELASAHQELESLKGELFEKGDELISLTAAKALVDFELAAMRKTNEALQGEVDGYYQESFESSRHTAWLSHERVRLSHEASVAASERAHWVSAFEAVTAEKAREAVVLEQKLQEERRSSAQELQHERERSIQEILTIRRSTSWRVTWPLRQVRLLFKTKN